jgi:deoxyribodipyrimidine photo-lyase
MKLYDKTIFIFRRDYRLNDNIGLIKCLLHSKIVIPIFIFTPEQIDNNIFKSNNAVQFMIESLIDLDKQLKKCDTHLYMFYGDNITILKNILKQINYDCIFFNKDYTPYSLERDSNIKKFCQENNIVLHTIDDMCLHPVGSVLTLKKDGYKKFTLYYKKAKKMPIPYPQSNNFKNYYNRDIKNEIKKKDLINFFKINNNIKCHGGRKEAKKILADINKHIYYNDIKDEPQYETSLLGSHIRFGTIKCKGSVLFIYK